MESASSYDKDSIHIHHEPKQQPASSKPINFLPIPTKAETTSFDNQIDQKDTYKVKCNLLDYHLQEAILINKALRSELKQYRDKIEFEKKLRKFLVNRVKSVEP